MKGNMEAFVLAHARGLSITDSAALAGMSLRTAQRRLKDPAVIELLENARSAHAQAKLERLTQWSDQAWETIAGLMESASETMRFKAASKMLGAVRDAVDLEELRASHEQMGEQLLLLKAERDEREALGGL